MMPINGIEASAWTLLSSKVLGKKKLIMLHVLRRGSVCVLNPSIILYVGRIYR